MHTNQNQNSQAVQKSTPKDINHVDMSEDREDKVNQAFEKTLEDYGDVIRKLGKEENE